MSRVLLCQLLIFFALGSSAQQMESKPSDGRLFVHTDKDVYLANETIWLSAYVFGHHTEELVQHKVLSIVLSRADSGQLLISEKYQIRNGLSSGKLILPDSIRPGLYKLIAYTDILKPPLKPVALFTANVYLGRRPNSDLKRNDPKSVLENGDKVLKGVRAQLLTDKQVYEKREMAKMKIKLSDSSGRPLQGLFSVSVAHVTRLNGNHRKIVDVYPQSLSNIIVHSPQPLVLNVKYSGRSIDRSVDIIMFGNNGLQVLSTNNKGRQQIDVDRLLTTYGKKISFMVSGNKSSSYQIDVLDTLLSTGILLAKEHILSPETLTELENVPIKLPDLADRVFELSTVTIKGGSRRSTSYKGVPGVNDCGDWVDEFDYLNYPYSQKRYQPIVGKQYKKRTDLNGENNAFKVEPVYYTGCETSVKKYVTLVKGINLESTFYGLDQSSVSLQYLTTLFWDSAILTDLNGNAEISFRTADLSGEYRIILQGITNDKVCYGEAFLEVK